MEPHYMRAEVDPIATGHHVQPAGSFELGF